MEGIRGPTEAWKEIPGTEGWYEVSSEGRVRSWHSKGNRGVRAPVPTILKPLPRNGYAKCDIYYPDGMLPRSVHGLVAEVFIGPRPEGMQVCHNDGDRRNNAASNLRYDTPSANNADKVAHGTALLGERHHKARLTEEQVYEIRAAVDRGVGRAELAQIYGVGKHHINSIGRRQAWAWLPELALNGVKND